MTLQRVGLPFLLLSGVALLPASVGAQAAGTRAAADSACTYTRCALRVDYGLPFLLGGAAVELIAIPYWLGSRRSLDRAVWWYNRDLPRP